MYVEIAYNAFAFFVRLAVPHFWHRRRISVSTVQFWCERVSENEIFRSFSSFALAIFSRGGLSVDLWPLFFSNFRRLWEVL